MNAYNRINYAYNRTNRKASGAINTEGLDTDTNNELNFAMGTRQSKAIAAQVAELVTPGHAVHPGQSGDYLVSKYGMTQRCENFAELQAFTRQLGVKQ